MTKAKTKREITSDALRLSMARSFVDLMKEKPIDKITVQEITDLAGVGRATWFRLFHSKETALSWLIQNLWKEYLIENGYTDHPPTDQENGILFFHFNYRNRDLLRLIYQQGMKYTVYEAYHQLLLPHPTDEIITLYIANTAAYATVGIIDEWIQRDFQETPEQLISLVSAVTQQSNANH